MLCFKITGLVLCPDKTGKLGNRGLGVKTVDVANLGDDTGGVHLADTGDRGKRIGNDLKLLLNGFVQGLDLTFQSSYGDHRHR
jgi:hypothetical protein